MISEDSWSPIFLDVAAILGVAVLLAAIHFLLPSSIQRTLAFDHERFAVYTLFSASYVHASNTHLYGNLLGYLTAATYTYILCVAAGERRWFRRTFAIFLLLLPVLVNLASYAAFSTWYPSFPPTVRGFSGVVAGFGGFLLVALAVYIGNRYSSHLGSVVGVSAFLVLMALVDVVYAGRVRPLVAGFVLAGIALEAGYYVRRSDIDVEELDRRAAARDVISVVLVFGVLAYVVLALFPSEIVHNGNVTNIVAHAIGFLLGIAIGFLTALDFRAIADSKLPASP